MRNYFLTAVLSVQFFLVGCAGVGILSTSDPDQKIQDAIHLYRVDGRPIPADRLIREAMEIYQERDDLKGLGYANLMYGDLLLASVDTKMRTVYTPSDGSVTPDNRVVKSREYATKALQYFQAAADRLKGTKKFDVLTGVYFEMALASHMQLHSMPDDREKTCEYYDKSFAAYQENIRLNPTAKPYAPPSYGSFKEMLVEEKKRLKCEGSV